MTDSPDILAQIEDLDTQKNSLLGAARAERVKLRERLEKLDEILAAEDSKPAPKPPRAAKGDVAAKVAQALASGDTVVDWKEWAEKNGLNPSSVARAVRKAKPTQAA